MKRFAYGWALLLAAISISLIGCGSSSNNTPQTRVRLINTAVGASGNQAVDVQVNGQTVLRNVGFGTESSAVTVDAGSNVPIKVLAAGTGTVLASNNANLTANVDQPLLYTGVTGAGGTQAPQIVALAPQDLTAPPTQGQVRIYFVDAVPELGPATFTITPSVGNPISNADMQNIIFPQMTPAEFTNFGTTTFSASVGGQTVTSQAVNLQGNNTYLVVLTGRPTSSGGVPPLALQVQPLT